YAETGLPLRYVTWRPRSVIRSSDRKRIFAENCVRRVNDPRSLIWPTDGNMRRDSRDRSMCIFVGAVAATPTASSRDVSDHRADPRVRVRVRGPEVGSLTSRLLSCTGHPRG